MRSNFQLLLLFCIITVSAYAQNEQPPSLNIGDPAPPLRVREWIKGTPIQRFEKGKVYVLEFWATWCHWCIAAMPDLSTLADQYKDNVTILGVDIFEKKTTSIKKVRAFVDSMGNRMNYDVAAEDSNFMETDWFDASGEQGIPNTFVVDAEGRLAWIGYPKELHEVLPKILNNTWDIQKALYKRNLDTYLYQLDDSAREELNGYFGNFQPGDLEGNFLKPGDLGKPDSGLSVIDEIVRKEPRLKYAPHVAFHTFSFLLITDPHKAFGYGKAVLSTTTYEPPSYDAITGSIKSYSDILDLPAEIYELGAKAYQVEIDQIPYPGVISLSRIYHKMAEWFGIANCKLEAIEAEEKAIEALKNEKSISNTDLAAFESRLRKYKNM
jgi:thiol-disulfide isomerase/thioredoxin